jgi:hypothetical protein
VCNTVLLVVVGPGCIQLRHLGSQQHLQLTLVDAGGRKVLLVRKHERTELSLVLSQDDDVPGK